MDKLKNLLRLALTQQARCLVMQSGQVPELILAVGRMPIAGQEPIAAAHVQSLYAQLLPAEMPTLAAKQAAKGYLQVPNVGRIQLLAIPTDRPALRLYLPPEGAALFTAEWPQFSAPAMAQPLAMAAGQSFAAPPPMAAPVAEPEVPKSMGYIPAGLMGQAPDMVVARAAPAAGMPGGMQPGVTGGMPLAMPGGQQAGMPLGRPAAPQVGMPGGAPQAGMPGAPSGMLGAPQAGMPGAPSGMLGAPQAGMLGGPQAVIPPVAPIAAIRPLQAVTPAFAPSPPHHAHEAVHSSANYTNPRVVDEPPATISFGPDQAGSAGISNGKNPIDRILIDMIKRKASDVHMTCGEPLCMRIDGDITRVGQSPLTPDELEQLLLPMIPPRNQTEFIAINDTDFAYEIRNVGRFRVNLFRDKNGVGSVMRHIPSTILTAEQLSLPPAITKFCSLSKGLVLVTGPTGSGKSTTLAAMIDSINKDRADHILTVEDPIEFVHTQQKCLINQREVHKHTGSFSRALKAALREDPDIVLIGEMRDLETVAIAIETAETGHLVFGTLHTNTAVSTIDRIIDQFPTDQQAQIRMMLAASLRGVVAQTLLKKKKGGRVAAHEILVTNDAVSAMIREGKNHMIANHMQSQKSDGNLLLNESLLRLVKDGVVDIDEAMRKAVDRSSFIEAAKRLGGPQPGQAQQNAAPGRPPHGGGGGAR